ncbi:MAG: hypothetical protein ACYDA9_18215 [Terriglobia bacterium]
MGTAKPAVPSVRSAQTRRIPVAPPGVKDELSRYDPEVRLDLLSDQQSRPLPVIDRNPFEFPAPKPVLDSRGRIFGPQLPPPPPPPPPLSIKLIGYTDKGGGVKVGIISDNEDIYVVREGETFDKIFKVTKLTPMMIEIYDQSTHRTVELPIMP